MGEDAANSNDSTKRVVGKPFKPGQSGNPSGRPAVAKEFRLRCREYMEAGRGGWAALIAMAKDKDERDRLRALELIAAYAYGRPQQGLQLTGENGAPLSVVILPAVSIPTAGEAVRKAE